MYRPLEVFGAFRNFKQEAQTYYGSFGSSKLYYSLNAALREGDGRGDGRDGRGDGRGGAKKNWSYFSVNEYPHSISGSCLKSGPTPRFAGGLTRPRRRNRKKTKSLSITIQRCSRLVSNNGFRFQLHNSLMLSTRLERFYYECTVDVRQGFERWWIKRTTRF